MSLFGSRCLRSFGGFVVQACFERGCLVSSFCEFVLRGRVYVETHPVMEAMRSDKALRYI